jgi:hypothetical protein
MMVNIEVDLYEAIRGEAFDTRRSMSKVINDAVRKHISKRKPAPTTATAPPNGV